MRIFIGQLNPIIGDIERNAQNIISCIAEAKKAKSSLVVFPEMAICGYNPEDLLLQKGFVEACERGLEKIVAASKGISVIVGTIRANIQHPGKPLHNSAAVIEDGELLGFQDKCLLPTYDVFDEWRYFEPALSERVWELAGKKVGVTICEDIWPAFDPFCASRYKDDPLEHFKTKSLDLLINISASPYSLGKIKTRREVAKKVSERLSCPVLVVNQVGAQDGLLFDGSSLYIGKKIFQAKSFQEERVLVDATDTPEAPDFEEGQELFSALTMGVRDYFHKQGFTKACLGLSGGIDSAVVACIAVEALGKDNVLGVLLPSRFTSSESRQDAFELAANLGIKTEEISIEGPFDAFLKLVSTGSMSVVEENMQSRIRAILLMAISNKQGYLVLNTGNKSELAMGYTTLYGDAVGSIAVLGDLLKRQVYEVAKTLKAIGPQVITKAPSAELRPNQKDSDTLPEYPILDTIVDEFVVQNLTAEEISARHNFSLSLVKDVIRKIHQSEYKRRKCPFALRVSAKAFSYGRRVPIVQKFQD